VTLPRAGLKNAEMSAATPYDEFLKTAFDPETFRREGRRAVA